MTTPLFSTQPDDTAMPPSVLIVDDEPSIREFLAFVLTDEGYRVQTASDGREAIDLAKRESPDVVITDLMMPRMDGYELIAHLRQECERVRAIIAMSAMNTAAGRTPGADLFIAKPFEVEDVLASVHALLGAPPCVPEDVAQPAD